MSAAQLDEATERRFFEKVDRGPDCWLWQGASNAPGYGRFTFDGRLGYAHRLSWQLANGRPIPNGLCILHKCDEPACVNPEHLRLGTYAENSADMCRKGRVAKRLTAAMVHAIRADVRTHRAIAAHYQLDHRTVGRLKTRESWRHLGGEPEQLCFEFVQANLAQHTEAR